MARSEFKKQVAQLRTFLVVAYVFLSSISLVAAFFLAWHQKEGAPWFIGASMVLAFGASITATCSRVTPSDMLGIIKVIGIKESRGYKEAA